MSNCSEQLRPALAAECALLGDQIAALGARLSAAADDAVAMQGFDALSQTAAALGALIGGLPPFAGLSDTLTAIAKIPLPAVRRRLHMALGLIEQEEEDTGGDADLWLQVCP